MKLHILTRYHHGRYERFKELVASLSGDFVLHVSIEEDRQREEVLNVFPSAVIVKVKRGTGRGFFNGYINALKAGINEPVWVLDSDDVAAPNAVENILKHYVPKAVNVFTIRYKSNMFLPSDRFANQISSQCLVWNPSEIKIDWVSDRKCADNIFLRTCKRYGVPIVLNGRTPVAWLKTNNNGR